MSRTEEPDATPIRVEVTHAARGIVHRFITLPGTLRPHQQAVLHAKVAGYLRSITVDKGDVVTNGQVLAEIEVPELIADRARLQVEARVAEIEAGRVTAARTRAPDLVTPQMVDEAQGRFEVAQARVEHADTLLRYSRIVAPFDGVVTARFLDTGAFVPAATAGASAATSALATVMDFRTVRAQVQVPELEASRITPGQPVRVTVEGIPGRVFEGVVSRHAYALDEDSRTMLVEADLPNPHGELRPGMYAIVRIGVETHADTLCVPAGALVVEKTGFFVWLADAGKARKRPVQVGFRDDARAEILGGLTGGETLIVPDKKPLTEGTSVQPGGAR